MSTAYLFHEYCQKQERQIEQYYRKLLNRYPQIHPRQEQIYPKYAEREDSFLENKKKEKTLCSKHLWSKV